MTTALTRRLSRRLPTDRPVRLPPARPVRRDSPRRTAVSRLSDRRGETLTETLISLLIIVAALTILAGGITTGARVNKQADTKYSVVFPPPMRGEEAHFTKDQYNVSFRLVLRDEALYDELSRRLALSNAETETYTLTAPDGPDTDTNPSPGEADGSANPYPGEADGVKTVEMKTLRVKVRRELALDRNGSDVNWRILYVLEDVVEKGADDEREPEENQIGE